MHEYYEKNFLIGSTEVDLSGHCRASVLLSYFQDITTEHSLQLQVDREYLVEHYHAVWLLVRKWYRLNRPLYMGENLTIRTWHRGAGGLIVYRDFDLYVGEEQVGEAIAAWVVADMETHQMLRPRTIAGMVASPVPEVVKEKQLKLIRSPKNRRHIYSKTVRFSDLDINGHMNNTRYADVILDAMTVEELSGRFLSELQLNYSMECRMGETIDISRATDENSYYVEGCSEDGTRRFESVLKFSKECNSALDETAVYE